MGLKNTPRILKLKEKEVVIVNGTSECDALSVNMTKLTTCSILVYLDKFFESRYICLSSNIHIHLYRFSDCQ